jgi:hypothetical protein
MNKKELIQTILLTLRKHSDIEWTRYIEYVDCYRKALVMRIYIKDKDGDFLIYQEHEAISRDVYMGENLHYYPTQQERLYNKAVNFIMTYGLTMMLVHIKQSRNEKSNLESKE